MPWVLGGTEPLLTHSHQAHNASASIPFSYPQAPLPGALEVYAPDIPEVLQPLLTASLVDDREGLRAAVLAVLASSKRIHLLWNPLGIRDLHTCLDAEYLVYAAVCLRVNALRQLTATFQAKQWDTAEGTHKQFGLYQDTKNPAPMLSTGQLSSVCPAAHEPATSFDESVFVLFKWLDAHLLLANTFDDHASVLTDNSDALAAVLYWCAPGPHTFLQEGDLPNYLTQIRQAAFFEHSPLSSEPLCGLFSKAIPQRCRIRDVIFAVETENYESLEMLHAFMAMTAATMLGVYRHVRNRPLFAARKEAYRFYFYDPPPHVCAALGIAPDTPLVSATGSRAEKVRAAFIQAEFDKECQTATMFARALRYQMWVSEPISRTEKRRPIFAHQEEAVNIIREFIIHCLDYMPSLYEELCQRTKWLSWQRSVMYALDSLRGKAAGTPFLKWTSETAPSTRLYQVPTHQFIDTVNATIKRFFLSGNLDKTYRNGPGLDAKVDALWTVEMTALMQHLVQQYDRHSNLQLTAELPDSVAEVHARLVPAGKFPLRAFFVSKTVVLEYMAIEQFYATRPAPTTVYGLVMFIAKHSLYDLQAVLAFTEAVRAHRNTYAVALPRYLAEQQVHALRKQHNLPIGLPVIPHYLTSFVCRTDGTFSGKVITEATNLRHTLQFVGNSNIGIAPITLEERLAKRMTTSPPTRAQVRDAALAHPSIAAYYAAFSQAETYRSVYPRNPLLDIAIPSDLQAGIDWLAAHPEPTTAVWDRSAPVQWEHSDVELPRMLRPEEVAAASKRLSGATVTRLQQEWAKLRGVPLLTGSTSSTPNSEPIRWVCALKKHRRNPPRHGVVEDTHREQDAITNREREQARIRARQNRWKSLFSYFQYTFCRGQRMLEVRMLGNALYVQGTIYIACTQCLSFTTLKHVRWHGASLYCPNCALREEAQASSGGNSLVNAHCIECGTRYKAAEVLYSLEVYDGVQEAITDVLFCGRHARKKAWLFASSLMLSRTTVMHAIKFKINSPPQNAVVYAEVVTSDEEEEEPLLEATAPRRKAVAVLRDI